MFGSKAIVQVVANPIVGPVTNRYATQLMTDDVSNEEMMPKQNAKLNFANF